MLIWIIFAVMTGAAVMSVLWPLGRRQPPIFADTAGATSLYRAQVAEIERDLGRRLIGGAEAEAAKAEAARRLLRAAEVESAPAGDSEPSLRRRRAASAIALSCVPLLALLVYGAYGSPTVPDQPLAARLEASPAGQDFEVALARIEAHLAANPSDGKGWSVLAPVYLRQGRFDDAARAFAAAIRHDGPSAERHAGQGEALTLAAGGVITAAARASLAEAVKLDPANPRARFFLAIGQEQDGNIPVAIAALKALLADAPAGAPWAAAVRDRLRGLETQSDPSAAIAALPEQDRTAAIRGMVEGLAARLAEGGGTLAEWSRLIRSQAVLGERPAALKSLATARERLAAEPDAVTALATLAGELGLQEAAR
ncbi:c-type cytochrome biogenesis protein CcmI [Bosea sp. (in: a-proteobacteria)]|uniref:c-type cytochrome biogenesis protein CcmI n=1 Tax=Bosea sp. (in: a-proteobacteria) TaxID=1871050 RepID=UPI002FC85B0F